MKIISGNSNRDLAQSIAEHCFSDLVPAKIDTFADGECNIEFQENIRGEEEIRKKAAKSLSTRFFLRLRIDSSSPCSRIRLRTGCPRYTSSSRGARFRRIPISRWRPLLIPLRASQRLPRDLSPLGLRPL